MLLNLLQNRGQMSQWDLITVLFSYLVLVLVMLPVHELAHAFVATQLGDNTARWHGRLTLNPFAHLDMWGTLMLVLCGFGYAKPVPVNSRNFRNPRRDMALVALAGPLSNILMALLVLVAYRVLLVVTVVPTLVTALVVQGISIVFQINIGLAVFNLLPIPPLDGSRIFSAVLPPRWSFWMSQHEHQIRMILFVLLATGALSTPLTFLSGKLANLLFRMVGIA